MTITVYSRPAKDCRACWSTEKRMEKYNVKHTKVLLDEATRKDIDHLGYLEAPVVVVTDDKDEVVDHWSGFREGKIAEYKG